MVEWWIPYACLFVASLAVTLVATPLAGRIAWRLGAVDRPSKRRINTRTTPRMGGIAVFLALIVAVTVQYLGTTRLGWPVVLMPGKFMTVDYFLLAIAFLVIFLTGAIDDVFQLRPLAKLAGQTLAACIAVAGGLTIGRIVNPFGGPDISLGWTAYPLTVLYLIAYVNVINLIDGLASGITFISCMTLFFMANLSGRLDAAALSISVAGATLGFLRYNFNPASIFLGDSGSLLLGFSLGTITLLNVTRMAGVTTIILPLVISFVPIVDTLSAIVRRKRAHVSVGHADKGHIHHRLISEGYNQRQAVLLIYAWTALLCTGSFFMTQVRVPVRIAIFCVLIGASFAFAAHLHLFEPVLRHHYNPKKGRDEIVGPDDPGFVEEAERAEERAEVRREKVLDTLLGEREANDAGGDD